MFQSVKRKEEIERLNEKIKNLESKVSSLEIIIKKIRKDDKDKGISQ